MNETTPAATPTSTAGAVSPDSGLAWTEEGAWPVAPGVHRIPLPLPLDGLRAINVYTVETDDGLTLIDGGWAIEASRAVLERSLALLGHTPADIRSFLVTHAHRDHYTQAVALRTEHGAHVSLGIGDKGSLDEIQDGFSSGDPHLAMLLRAGAADVAKIWGNHAGEAEPDPSVWGYPDTWLEGDHTVAVGERRIDAVSTPGHTQGHFVFADTAAGLLFSGDHVLPTITPSIGFEGGTPEQPLGDFMTSLAKVRALPDLRLLPAHGPLAPSSHARAEELLAHHEHRLAQCLELVGSGERTAYEVAGGLGWTRHERRLESLDVFNTALATMETRAHLVLLVARGDVTVADVDGVDVYRRVGGLDDGA
ncbi:MBL fold metallo-hydrolase [Nocardioides sp. 616]|uniref:MBL fold metallo-hydrolase n=1 Tax=Nocardioides sp. 616 TaxID=2268090 RepID=UPI000CE3C60B|nr:MBL fold metallo-hydrolase [Nocardioides sp. 616]